MSTEIAPYADVRGKSLKEILAPLNNKQRLYILYRICEMDKPAAMSLAKVKKSSYNLWCNDNEHFVPIHRMIKDMFPYKEQAMKELRRRTQLGAIILEEKIINKVLDEVERNRYNILKTRLVQAVYDKLMSDLDIQPMVHVSWTDRLKEYFDNGGINAINVSQEDNSEQAKYPQGYVLPPIEQADNEVPEEAEEATWEVNGQDSLDEAHAQDS